MTQRKGVGSNLSTKEKNNLIWLHEKFGRRLKVQTGQKIGDPIMAESGSQRLPRGAYSLAALMLVAIIVTVFFLISKMEGR